MCYKYIESAITYRAEMSDPPPSIHQLASSIVDANSAAEEGSPKSAYVNWLPVVTLAAAHYKAEGVKAAAANAVLPVWECYTQEHTELQRSSGDGRLAALRDALSHMDTEYPRSVHQRQFHDAFTASCIRNIYKEEYSANHLRILEENGWAECRQEVFICCPRRFGKTFAVAMYVAAYAWSQPNQRVCIFSPSRRQSKMLLDQIKKFVCMFTGANDAIKKYNQEELHLQGGDDVNDIRVVCSYPSKVSIGATTKRARVGYETVTLSLPLHPLTIFHTRGSSLTAPQPGLLPNPSTRLWILTL